MVELTFQIGDSIDDNLVIMWMQCEKLYPTDDYDHGWALWLRNEIVPGCDVIYDLPNGETTIIFESEEHKNWFILKYG